MDLSRTDAFAGSQSGRNRARRREIQVPESLKGFSDAEQGVTLVSRAPEHSYKRGAYAPPVVAGLHWSRGSMKRVAVSERPS